MSADNFWDERELVVEIENGEHSKFVVDRCKKAGKDYVSIREFWNTKSDPEWRPGKSGMAIKSCIFEEIISKFKTID